MRKIIIPTCPSCLDGGKVELIDVPHDAIGVFEPVPKGWEGREFRCECGWSMPAGSAGKEKDDEPRRKRAR